MSKHSDLLDEEQFPYTGSPPKQFCSISLCHHDHRPFTDDEFLEIREEIISLLVPYPLLYTFPLNYTNNRRNCVMVCFECTPRFKPMLEELIHNHGKCLDNYRSTIIFDSL